MQFHILSTNSCKDNRFTDKTYHAAQNHSNYHQIQTYVPITSRRTAPPPLLLLLIFLLHYHHLLLLPIVFLNYGLAFSSANLTSFCTVSTLSSFKRVISPCSCNSIGCHYFTKANVRILLSHIHNIYKIAL